MLPTHHSPSSRDVRELSDHTTLVDSTHSNSLGRAPIPASFQQPDAYSSSYDRADTASQSAGYELQSPESGTSTAAGTRPLETIHSRGPSAESSVGDGSSSHGGQTYVGSSSQTALKPSPTEDDYAHQEHPLPSYATPSSQQSYDRPQPSYLKPLGGDSSGESDNDSDLGTATETDDEFDWDESDDNTPAGANGGETAETIAKGGRKSSSGVAGGAGKHRARRGRRVYLWLMGLSRAFRMVLIAMVGAAILITPFAVVITEFRDVYARTQVQVWSIFLCISFVFGCLTVVLVDFLPHLFTVIIYHTLGKVPENLKTYVELLMALSLYTKLFLCSAWTWITFSITRAAVKPTGTYWVYINRVLEAIFAALLVLLAEKLLLQAIAINFHRTSLRDRLDENGEALRALDKLSHAVKAAKKRPNHFRNRSAQKTATLSRPGTPGGTPPLMTGAPPSRANTPRSYDFAGPSSTNANGRPSSTYHGPSPLGATTDDPTVTTSRETHPPVDETNPAHKKRGFRAFRQRRQAQKATTTAAKVVTGLGKQLKQVALLGVYGKGPEIGSLSSARQLAKKLFANLEKGREGGEDGEAVLYVEDFLPYFRNEEDAAKAFKHFDSDGNGDISKREMRAAVQRIYKERKALTASLADMSSAISKLDGVLLVVALVICIFIFLLIFNKTSTVESLVPVSTFVLGFSFIFSNSAKTLFESLIFIFATHPFDVGDLVLIDADFLYVKEFGLVSTTFRRWDAQEIIAPNALLATTKLIHNIRRSRAMWEVCSIQIAYDTPLEVLEEINVRVKQYLAENNREWGGGHQVNINNITNMNYIYLDIAIEHKSNWQDWGAKWMRRTIFLKHLKNVLHELEVTYQLPVQPVMLPAGSENMQSFANNLFPGARDNGLGNAGGSNGTLSASPYRSGPPQPPGGGLRPDLTVNTGFVPR